MKKQRKEIALSVRQRLLNLSRERKEDFQLLLTRYGLERFLFRLSQSPHKDSFILKGALLFLVWDENTYRPTRDADLLGQGDNSLPHLKKVFQEICTVAVPDDGVNYLPDTVEVQRIKEDEEYEGVRVTLEGKLTAAKIPIQVDIGFGDTVFPAPKVIKFPTLLEFTAPSIKAYPPETVIAEKFHAMVHLGIANSRMKDFYDIWIISKRFSFDGKTLSQAIQKTFERRKTSIPSELPLPFTPEFFQDTGKQTQWKAFVQRNKLLPGKIIGFDRVIDQIKEFIMPLLKGLSEHK